MFDRLDREVRPMFRYSVSVRPLPQRALIGPGMPFSWLRPRAADGSLLVSPPTARESARLSLDIALA